MAEDRQGQIWAAGKGLKRLTAGHLAPYPLPGNETVSAVSLLADHDGALWIGTRGQGLLRLYHGRLDRFTRKDGLSHDFVNSLLEDREGNLWVGTNGGLDQFRAYPVTTISTRQGLPSTAVTSIFAAQAGGLWIGTTGGLHRLEEGRAGAFGAGGLSSGSIQAIFEEQGGRLWVVTKDGLAYWDGGRFRPLRHPDGKPVFLIAAAEDGGHSVWLSDPRHGLLRVRDAHIVDSVAWSTFQGRVASALETIPGEDGLWLGFDGGGVAWYESGQPVRWHSTPGTGEGASVMDLHRTTDGALWIAARESLSRLQGERLQTLTVNQGLPCDRIVAMVEDDGGAFWLNTACGLVRIRRDDLSQWTAHPAAQINPRVYDSSDGLGSGPPISGYFRRAAKSKDGRLWFAAFEGLAVVDPRRLAENPLPPPVRIEALTAGKIAYPLGAGLRLPPRPQDLRIDFTALTFVAPDKARFRYRLEGFESEWHEGTGPRQAVYTNLPPRSYTFRVTACNNDGVWSPDGAAIGFAIDPAFDQTRWFLALCLSALLLVLWGAHRFRLRRVRARMNLRFEAQLAERNRIAAEMHDTVLQQLCGFALQLEGLTKSAAVPPAERDRLREIRTEIQRCMRQAREFVTDLRAPLLEEKNLLQALQEAGEQITQGEAVHFHVTVSGRQRPAPPQTQQQLLRIVQEATRNAVRYSRANQIEVRIAYLDCDKVRVQMRDDGCGFDLEKAVREPGHWGLTTMRERAAQMGAELHISSAPGRGTEVDILVPMASPPK